MHPLLLHSFAVLFSLSTPSLADADERLRGFSIDLIHRDSPLSPFYINSEYRSFEYNLTATTYTYLVKLRVGNPDPVDTFAVPDTGSDLIWLNGQGCNGTACKDHDPKAKFIEKPMTHTPQDVCSTEECKELRHTCPKLKNICGYSIAYKDGFVTQGELTRSKFWFPISGADGRQHEFEPHSLWFGLSTYSNGTFESSSAGIVGLGRGKLSLLRQLGQLGFDLKFSYCLPRQNSNSTSKLRFGDQVTMARDKSTQLFADIGGEGYYVRLANITVNNEPPIMVSDNIQLDTGTTFTALKPKLFSGFIKSVKEEIGSQVSTAIDPYRDCFKYEDGNKLMSRIPSVSFNFDDTTVKLKQQNLFDDVPIDDKTKWHCLTVVEGKEEDPNILGSRAQIGFSVAFDLDAKKVSFDPHDCSEQNAESLVSDE